MAFSYSSAAANGGVGSSAQSSLVDLFSTYKYKETIGFLYLDKVKARLMDVKEIMAKLRINVCDILGVQHDSERWFGRLLCKFKSTAANVFDRLKNMDGEIIQVRGGEARVMIQDMTGEVKYVSVSGIPYEVPDEVVANLMSRFGTVKSIRMNYFQQALTGIANGTRCVKMIIKKDIPSCIKIGNRAINVSYTNQTKTCFKCGQILTNAHMGRQCVASPDEIINNINDENFPVLIEPTQ